MNDVGNTLTAASSLTELFGMTYQMETKGMLISSVVADSVSYGKLQAGDLIVKLTDIKEYIPIVDANGKLQVDSNGNLLVERYVTGLPKLANSPYASGVLLEGATTTQVGSYLTLVYSATFHVLRNGQIVQVNLTRNKVGISYDENNVNPNKRYDFKFVEYYFGDDVTNISTVPVNSAGASTYQLRGLDNMPADTGYVRLVQFDQITDEKEKVVTSGYTELKTALELFKKSNLKYLVLDLKDNPGGYVHLAVNIAGMLIHPNHLSIEQKNKVETNAGIFDAVQQNQYIVTTLVERDGRQSTYKAKSSYYSYFPQTELANGKKRIIVWTDGGSASASELLLGALLDYGTAVHMGTKTYGKGIAQTIEPLNIAGSYVDKSGRVQTSGEYATWAVYYTFANYYSPLGTNIHGVGYAPASNHQASNYNNWWDLARGYWGI
jgi:C-terminal processing protease CtpA/Prc